MIEVAMGFGLGFLTACLLTLIIAPLIYERAVRVTTQKLFAVTPSSSLVEMQAEKDLLRAEFAMAMYRFETRLAAMRAKNTALFGQIGKQAAEISHLKIALIEKSSAIVAYQAREQVRRSTVRRIITLLLWMFDRTYRRKNRLPSTEALEHVAAPPLQNVSNELACQDEPATSLTDRLLAPPRLTLGLRSETAVPELVLTDLRRISIAPGQCDLPGASTNQIAISVGLTPDFDGRPITNLARGPTPVINLDYEGGLNAEQIAHVSWYAAFSGSCRKGSGPSTSAGCGPIADIALPGS